MTECVWKTAIYGLFEFVSPGNADGPCGQQLRFDLRCIQADWVSDPPYAVAAHKATWLAAFGDR